MKGRKFYVSIVDSMPAYQKHMLALGPFSSVSDAKREVDRVRSWAQAYDPKSAFYAFGVVAVMQKYCQRGALNLSILKSRIFNKV